MAVRELTPWLLACGSWLDYSRAISGKSLVKAGYLTLSACAVYSMEPPNADPYVQWFGMAAGRLTVSRHPD